MNPKIKLRKVKNRLNRSHDITITERHPGKGSLSELFPEKIPLGQLAEIWNEDLTDENSYTENELFNIREWLYTMAKIIIDIGNRSKNKVENILHPTRSFA